MNHRVVSILALGGVAAWPCLGAFAEEDLSREVANLRDEVTMLRAELAAVARDDQDWLTEERADQIRGLVSEVLADADTRVSLLQRQGMTNAGWDKKFFLQSDDGNYRLNVGGQLMVRYAFNYRDNPGAGEDSSRGGFTVRRAKLAFSGHLVDPSWQFAIQGAYERDQTFNTMGSPVTSGEMRLQDAYIVKEFDDNFSIQVGQFKGPYMKEELLSSKRFQAAERSLVNERFNQDRTQGVALNWEYDQWRLAASYNDGPRSANQAALAYDTEYSVGARFELLGAGTWKQFRSYADFSGNEAGYLLGVAAQYWRAESGTAMPDPKEKVFDVTADVMVHFGGGLSMFGAFVYRDLDQANLNQWGAVVQAGYFLVPDEWDIFARYEYGDDDGVSADNLSVLTVGFNRYFDQHNVKWTTDFGYGFNPVSSSWDSGGAQWLADGPGEDGQFVLRSQLQLLF